jgi:GntR family transcriptional regulator/MocR family aminotransferase
MSETAIRPRRSAVAELAPFDLDRASGEPLHRQLYRTIRQRILDGHLKPGTRLPSSRALASDHGVARNTVVTALEQLASEGFLIMRVGHGTRVAEDMIRPTPAAVDAMTTSAFALSEYGERLSHAHRTLPAADSGFADFQPGVPDVREFPRSIWSRLVSQAYRFPPSGTETYAHGGGFAPLRESLAGYLSAARGVRCESHQVLVTTTAQAAVDLTARMLTDPGEGAFVETPGYVGARAAFQAHGLVVRGVPVDADGVDVHAVETGSRAERIGYITPSHQFPYGTTLSLDRRLALLRWTTQRDAWLVEDDYDSEFRYAARPVAAVQGLTENARVIYVGSFAKTLFPGLRVAFMVVPSALAQPFTQALRQTGQEPSLPLQAALHAFIEGGHFARHVRRLRGIYSARQQDLLRALRTHFHDMGEPLVADGGLQLTFQLADHLDDVTLARQARAAGFGVEPLARYGAASGPGLVFGVGACRSDNIDARIQNLRRVLTTEDPAR